ncbi:type II toxin-antitoxin system RelE family toxin [Geoalkalibacter halelectricus]|uniref:type II toxin-antitoxin system RelE family toxin n=1 Tax=Geoalkalibacter halelectricus TaxID=2847045 RepID=UPI00345FEAAB
MGWFAWSDPRVTGTERIFRARTGDYRVVYNIVKDVLVVEVIRVGHRKDICRQPL